VLIADLIPEWTQFEAFLDEHRQRSQPLPGRADRGASTPVAGAVPDHVPRPGQARGFVEKVWFDETITTGRAEIGTETADLCTVMRLDVRIEART
jgi:hypothetical protein